MRRGAPLPENETERLTALHALDLLDTPAEERFDRITRLTQQIFAMPIVVISLVDQDRQWFKSCYGLSSQENPREHSFCAYTLLDDRPLVVPDTLEDERFVDHPLVLGEPHIRFYAGYPVHDQNYVIGTLCLIDRVPHPFPPSALAILEGLAQLVEQQVRLTSAQFILLPGVRRLARFHTIFDDAAIGMVMLDEQGNLLEWNSRFEQLLGWQSEAVQERVLTDLLDPDGRGQTRRQLQALFQRTLPVLHGEYAYRRPDGLLIELEVTFSLTADVFSQQSLCIGLLEDITARKEAERRSDRAMLQMLDHAHVLEKMQKQQRQFVSVVSHEFRTSLTSIRGFSELLQQEEFTPLEVHEFANDICQDALRLLRMINDLLDVERMREGKEVLQIESFPVVELLRQQLRRARVTTSKHTFRLLVEDRQLCIQGDRDKLSQVFANLLSNAIKYSPQGGCITLSCQQEANTLHLQIQDQGMGITPDALEIIFDAYSRGDAEKTRYIQGTGLGLAIVKQIVQMHRGKVWAESTLEQGTTFHLVLPLWQEPQKAPDTKQPEVPNEEI